MKEREFANIHVDAVTERLRDYERVLTKKGFEQLDRCDICSNAPYICEDGREGSGCNGCLFFYEDEKTGRQMSCIPEEPGDPLSGSCCYTKKQQRVRFKRLLRRLEQNGWTFE
jgi:hypothetical protein